MSILYEEETYRILGACFEVYNELGCGFLESVYQEALAMELAAQGIRFHAHPEMKVAYKGTTMQQTYRPDFICCGKIVLEIKAVSGLTDVFRAQCHNYLKVSDQRLALLCNFGAHPKVQYERIIR